MNIAINTRFLIKDKMEGFGWYTFEITRRLVQNHPEHTFYLFFDREVDPVFDFGDNAIPVVLTPKARHPILFIYWFEWKVKKALKKYHIDRFFSPDGYASLTSKVPQVLTIHDINFEHNPEDLPLIARWYLRTFVPRFARKAEHILTVSEYSKQDIVNTYGIPASKVTSIWNGVAEVFQPMEHADKLEIRNTLTGGRPYFLFVGSLHPRKNITRLIEAYNLYLERSEQLQKWHLVIVGQHMWRKDTERLPISDRAQEKVHFTGHLPIEDLAVTMAAASGFVYVPYFEGFGIPLVEAMRSSVPIIAGNQTSLPEVAGEAALYCDPFDVEAIAKAMLDLSQSATLQDTLRTKGLERSKLFSWDKAAEEVVKQLL